MTTKPRKTTTTGDTGPWQGLSTAARRFAERMARLREDAIDDLRHVTDLDIARYIRSTGLTSLPDGHKASMMSDGRGGGELTSVESNAERLAFPGTEGVPEIPADRTLAAMLEFFVALKDAEVAADRIVRRMNEIERLRNIREYRTGGRCACCDRDVPGIESDRLRDLYCSACWMAYVRAGRPDNRRAFEDDRRNFLDGNNETAGQTA